MKKTLYFSSDAEFEAYYGASGKVPAGEIAVVGDYKKVYTSTNNIDGTSKDYEAGIPESGSINITENGENIDVAEYATANVNVPIPAGYIIPTGSKSITANGEAIDIAEYATANVNVPIPAGYIQPTGNYAITANGENIDIAQYATVSVNVAAPSLTWIDFTLDSGFYYANNLTENAVYKIHVTDMESGIEPFFMLQAYSLGAWADVLHEFSYLPADGYAYVAIVPFEGATNYRIKVDDSSGMGMDSVQYALVPTA